MKNTVRIEVFTDIYDTRATTRKKKLLNSGFSPQNIQIADVYTINRKFSRSELERISSSLTNPVTQKAIIRTYADEKNNYTKFFRQKFDWAIEIGFLPGVTDNVSHTAKEIIEDLLRKKFAETEGVYTSQITFVKGNISLSDINKIAATLYNPLIGRMHIKSYKKFMRDKGMDFIVPLVKLNKVYSVTEVDLNVPTEELKKIGKQGIVNADGTTRGPLALDLRFMEAIRAYFNKLKRNPTDIELESLAQTWSEHCKHTIFSDPLDELDRGLLRTYIKKATEEIRKKKGKKDFCVSVFSDNSGAIEFDDKYLVTHKVETHNSPSALDPFGGAVTGIVGVNRDTIGFGLGAKPISNFYGFCLADPQKDIPLYKGAERNQRMLSARRIMDGVIEGVNAGGNQSGIPTPQGFLYFDERYRGKPLVFCGTVGLIPKYIDGKAAYLKRAKRGDYIVMIGGRVGKDGIHGATFSSEALNSGSPVTAVQIGDPITQKKLSDVLIREVRQMLLYNSITDNGAGGLSCSVAEMAKESGGCMVNLEKVPLKYPRLAAWEIWISESQERMTLAIPKKNWDKFADLMEKRGVEATVIGEFTDSGKCIVKYRGAKIMDIDLDFLHNGLPRRSQVSTFSFNKFEEPKFKTEQNLTKSLLEMVGRLNTASFEFISQQYDHVVLGNNVLGPIGGRGRINTDTSVIRPVISSKKGAVLSCGLYPNYSDIDTYHMAAASLDTAVRNAVSVGADPDYLALLDNFCWCSSNESQRLGQLKRAARACYDLARAYGTPFISGKDSMFNDFIGYNQKGTPLKISIPPTLLITSMGVVNDVTATVSSDVKFSGDLVYILGETFDELGASEYFRMMGEKAGKTYIGNNVPKVNAAKNKKLYKRYHQCIKKGLISAAQSIGLGGLGLALTKMSMAGLLGMELHLDKLPGKISRDDISLFSESQGRIVVAISPDNKTRFEKLICDIPFAEIGKVAKGIDFTVFGKNHKANVQTNVYKLLKNYRQRFNEF